MSNQPARHPFKRLLHFMVLLAGLLIFSVQPVAAVETHELVADLWPGTQDSTPTNFFRLLHAPTNTDILFLTAQDDNTFSPTSKELWKIENPTAAIPGTPTLVKDINPGTQGSDPAEFVAIDNIAYFTANDGTHGVELWRSDGTEAGTYLVKDIIPGSTGSLPQKLIVIGSTLYFSATTTTNGRELWKSDGTEVGTQMVVDLYPGTTGGLPTPSVMASMGGLIYFQGDNGTTGRELWVSNGTAGGTTLVKDISPGSSWSNPQNFLVVGSTLYFAANDGTHGTELWKSDGTALGTVLVKDINPGTATSLSPFQPFVAVGSTIFFIATDVLPVQYRIWRSDGTELGTTELPFSPTIDLSDLFQFRLAATTTGLGYYQDDGVNGKVLWGHDLIDKPAPCQDSSGRRLRTSVIPQPIQVYNNLLLTSAYWPDFGAELAVCNPQTQLANYRQLHTGFTGGHPQAIYVHQPSGFAFMSARHRTASLALGREPYRFDFNTNRFLFLGDIRTVVAGSFPASFYTLGNRVIFTARTSEHNSQLWRTDGTAAGTQFIAQINPFESSQISIFAEMDGYLYFRADDGLTPTEVFYNQLWRTDGTAAGTQRVTSVPFSASFSTPVVFNGLLYFSGYTSDHGSELWVTDGTPAGTSMLKDINPGPADSEPREFTIVGNQLFFSAETTANGRELWVTDGTEAGTQMVKDINPGPDDSITNTYFAAVNNQLLFFASNGTDGENDESGNELWRSDGTEAGTVLVKDISPGPISSAPIFDAFIVVGNQMIFRITRQADDNEDPIPIDDLNRREPWISDGTEAGTRPLKATGNPSGAAVVTGFVALGNIIFFEGTNDLNGSELWISNLTDSGTLMWQDIYPGDTGELPNSSVPQSFFAVGGRVFFSANTGNIDPATGRELWVTGTNIGSTYLYADINPGTGSSSPQGYADLNGVVIFSAVTPGEGRELHKFRAYYPVYLPTLIR